MIRFTRCKSIGEDYTEDKIKDRIKNNKYRSVNFSVKRLNKIIDIDSNTKTKNSKGYEIWARKHNLKTMASSISMLRKLGINTKDQLENHIKKQMKDRQKLLNEMKILDKKIDKLSQTMEDVNAVNKHRKVYLAYMKDPKNPVFDDYKNEIKAYSKALEKLKKDYNKMPTTKDILKELEKVQEKKNTLFKEYSSVSNSSIELVNIKNNYEKYIGMKSIDDMKNTIILS